MVNIIHIMLAFCFMFYFISSTSVASGNYTKEKCILQMVRANILKAKQLKVGMLASGVEKNEEKDSTKNNYTIHPFGSQKAFHVLVPLCDHLEKVEKIKMEDNKADSGVEKNEEKDDKGVEKNEEKDPIKPDSVATYNIGSNLTENVVMQMVLISAPHRQTNAKKRQGSVLQSENVVMQMVLISAPHRQTNAKKRQGTDSADSGVEKNEEKDDKGVEKNEEKAVLARSDAMNADSADSELEKMLMDGKLQRQQAREKVQKLKSELYTDENGIIDEELFQQDSKQLKVGMLASVEEIFKKLAEIKDKRSKLILKDLLKTCTNLWGSGEIKKVIELNNLLPTCYDVNKFYGFRADNAEIVKIANDLKIAHTTKTVITYDGRRKRRIIRNLLGTVDMIAKERSKLFVDVFYNLKNTCEFLFLYGQKTHISDISFTAEDFLPLCILAKRNRNEEFFKETPIDFCDALN